ncbi:macoilin-like isoform X2 [Convolutriloba macropyga]|uniref:macoilin-like isoform X2 n=1 Tax=Convolutriloba macropyga TaxID=536237 RepID=UPI003F523B62
MIKRRLDPTRNNKRPNPRPKKSETIYNSTLLYLKFVLVWGGVLLADFMLGVRFEYLWPVWLFLQSVHDTYKYQGLAFSLFFSCLSLTSDILCSYAIKDDWIFFLASSYVWVQYVWHTERGVCFPTIFLWFLFVWVEAAVRLKDISKDMSHRVNLCRPFAAHSIGYPVVTLGFGFKSYITYKLRLRKQLEVQKENDFYFQLLKQALPKQHPPFAPEDYPAIDDEGIHANGHIHHPPGITHQPTPCWNIGGNRDAAPSTAETRTRNWVQGIAFDAATNSTNRNVRNLSTDAAQAPASNSNTTSGHGGGFFPFLRNSKASSNSENALHKSNSQVSQHGSTGGNAANVVKSVSGYTNSQSHNSQQVTCNGTASHTVSSGNPTQVPAVNQHLSNGSASSTSTPSTLTNERTAATNTASNPKIPDTMKALAKVSKQPQTSDLSKGDEPALTVGAQFQGTSNNNNASAAPSTVSSVSAKSSQSNKKDSGGKKLGGSNSGSNTGGSSSRKQRGSAGNFSAAASPDMKLSQNGLVGIGTTSQSVSSSSIATLIEPNNNLISPTSIDALESLNDVEKAQKIEKLEITVKSLTADLSAKSLVNQELSAKISSLTSSERHSKHEIEQLKCDKKGLEERVTDLSLQKVAANTKVETLEKKLETEKKAKSDAERRVLEEKTRAKRTVEEEVTKFMSDMAKKNECTSSNCSKRAKELEVEKNQLQIELARKSERMQNVEQEVETLRVLRDELTEKSREIARVQELNSRLESSLSMENKYKMELFSALNECNRKINSYQMEISQKNKEIMELQYRNSFASPAATGDSRYPPFMPLGAGGPHSSGPPPPPPPTAQMGGPLNAPPGSSPGLGASLAASQMQEGGPSVMAAAPGTAQATTAPFFLPQQIQAHVTRSSPINLSNLNPEAMVYSPVSNAAIVSSVAGVVQSNSNAIQTSGAGGTIAPVVSMMNNAVGNAGPNGAGLTSD